MYYGAASLLDMRSFTLLNLMISYYFIQSAFIVKLCAQEYDLINISNSVKSVHRITPHPSVIFYGLHLCVICSLCQQLVSLNAAIFLYL